MNWLDKTVNENKGIEMIGRSIGKSWVHKFMKEFKIIDRRSGQTTRLVDKAIQDFFKHGEIDLADHHPGHKMKRHILSIFLHRLEMEHGISLEDLYIRQKEDYTFIKISHGKGSD